MTASATFAAWIDFARGHSLAGADNCFTLNGDSYSFDARPRRLENGALQGRIYRQGRGQNAADIGGFKIDARGIVVAIPDELRNVLPMVPPPPAPLVDRFSTDDVEGLADDPELEAHLAMKSAGLL